MLEQKLSIDQLKGHLRGFIDRRDYTGSVHELRKNFSTYTFDHWMLVLDELARQGVAQRLFPLSPVLPKYPHELIFAFSYGSNPIDWEKKFAADLGSLIRREPKFFEVLLDIVFANSKQLPLPLENYSFYTQCDHCGATRSVDRKDLHLTNLGGNLSLPDLTCGGCNSSLALKKKYHLPENSIPNVNEMSLWRQFLTKHFTMTELIDLRNQLLSTQNEIRGSSKIDELINFILDPVRRQSLWDSLRRAVEEFEFPDPFPELVNLKCGYCGAISQATLSSNGTIQATNGAHLQCRGCSNSADFSITTIN